MRFEELTEQQLLALAISLRLVAVAGQVVIRPMMYVALTISPFQPHRQLVAKAYEKDQMQAQPHQAGNRLFG